MHIIKYKTPACSQITPHQLVQNHDSKLSLETLKLGTFLAVMFKSQLHKLLLFKIAQCQWQQRSPRMLFHVENSRNNGTSEAQLGELGQRASESDHF